MAGAADLLTPKQLNRQGVAGGATAGAGTTVTALTLAKDAYQKALARIGNKRAQTLQQYGYRSTGYDAQGNPTGLQVDQYNQYGEFQQMLHDDARAAMLAQDESIGRGLGAAGGGLGNQGESEVQYQHGLRSYELGRGFTGAFTDLNQEQLGAEQDYAQAQWEAQRQAALDAIAAQSYSPYGPDPGQEDYPPTDDTPVTPVAPTAQPGASTPYIDAAAAFAAANPNVYIHQAGQTEVNRALAAARAALRRAQ